MLSLNSKWEQVILQLYFLTYLCFAIESPAVPLYPPIKSRYLSEASATLKMEYSAKVTFPSKSSWSTLSFMLPAAAMRWRLSFPSQNSPLRFPNAKLVVRPSTIEIYWAIHTSLKNGPTASISGHVTADCDWLISIRINAVHTSGIIPTLKNLKAAFWL